jgi:trk system potassium uptake protein TrkH
VPTSAPQPHFRLFQPARQPLAQVPGLLILAVVLAVVDALLALTAWISLGLTALESLLALPWALAVLRLEGLERRLRPLHRLHLGTIGLLLACLAAKWHVLLQVAPAEGVHAYRTYTLVAALLAVVGLVGRGSRLGRLVLAIAEQPARLMLLSFGGAALLGGFALTLPVSLRALGGASIVDGLFTATSAVCVTGLAVNDIATTYTPFGQFVILLLIQAGGLGIMVLSTFFVIVAGQRLRVRSSAVLAETIDAESLASLRRAIVGIVVTTFALEAVGAGLLYLAFLRYPGIALGSGAPDPLSGAGGHLWAAVFHSVSAFCNAGFSLFPRNLAPFVGDPWVNLVVMGLILLGGIGFPVLAELGARLRLRVRRERPPRLSLHSRVALATSGALVLGLAAVLLGLERAGAFAQLSWPEKLLAALFKSVTARTAGFNTVDTGALAPASLFLICAVMFVGASPGSTGGGIKTTTLATLVATLRATLRGEPQARIFDRALGEATTRRAIGVAFLSGVLVAFFAFVLLIAENGQPLGLIFEAVSAFATVGLSTGITASLSVPGRLVLILTMLIGRIGPLTLALALAGRGRPVAVGRPEERLLIG